MTDQSTPTDETAPLVGVVVAAFNTERYVGVAVQSLLAQTYPNWTAVVVDDGSTDGTADVARSAAGGDPRVRVVSQPNSGRSAARNRGESELPEEARYVLFLDADDTLQPAAFQRMAAYLDQHPHVGCVGCQFIPIDEQGEEIPPSTLRREKSYRTRWVPGPLGFTRELRPDEPYTPFISFYTGSGVGPHALYRRELFRGVGGYDTQFDGREDHDLFMRFSLAHVIHYLPDKLYDYRLHATQSTKNHEKFRAEARRISEKWASVSPADKAQQDHLQAARAYKDLLHQPLRDIRNGLRAAKQGNVLRGLLRSGRGLAQFPIGWLYYLARWHGKVMRSVREPVDNATRLGESACG